ncbi:MAG: diadenosine tetraphosphate hydrolase [Chloroflexi bacterium HGW-Chloroflexi-10]|nr:MAG: diadenosine tetraphosphate hydrolase [Chloroflexi bacterium HGW-Chloroflexi-10]
MHNHAPENYICPFCLLLQGIKNDHTYSNQSDIVHHDDTVTAFIGSHQWPNNPGNTIVIPNQHYENIFDLPIRYAQEIQRAAKRLALAMKTVYTCDGVSTRQHNEPAGNQDVWHYHVHVTPRFQNDNFYNTIPQRAPMPPEERAQHATLLRSALNSISLNE